MNEQPIKVMVDGVPTCPRCGRSGMVVAVLQGSAFTAAACCACDVVWKPGQPGAGVVAAEVEVADLREAVERMIERHVLEGEPQDVTPRGLFQPK